jgi:hypothetical protein
MGMNKYAVIYDFSLHINTGYFLPPLYEFDGHLQKCAKIENLRPFQISEWK